MALPFAEDTGNVYGIKVCRRYRTCIIKNEHWNKNKCTILRRKNVHLFFIPKYARKAFFRHTLMPCKSKNYIKTRKSILCMLQRLESAISSFCNNFILQSVTSAWMCKSNPLCRKNRIIKVKDERYKTYNRKEWQHIISKTFHTD